MNSILDMTDANPTLTSYAFYVIWELKQDITGGLAMLNNVRGSGFSHLGHAPEPMPTLAFCQDVWAYS